MDWFPAFNALLPPTVNGVTTYGAVSRADGSATLLARKDGQHDLELVSAPVTGPATEQPSLLASDVDAPEDATIAWDYINRAMPVPKPGSLTHDEVYSLVAFLLYRNGIIPESDVLDAQSLPKVQMPNRNGFVPAKPVYPPEPKPSWW